MSSIPYLSEATAAGTADHVDAARDRGDGRPWDRPRRGRAGERNPVLA